MNEDLNKVLASKRAWQKSDGNRRNKDGNYQDRKLTADCLRAGKATEIRIRDMERRSEHSAFMVAICLLLALFMLCWFGITAHAYTPDELANAIYKAENSPRHPYGVLAHYKHTTPRQACLNSIRHRLAKWNGQGDFIVFLGQTYSPPAINPNWVRLVHYFLRREA